MEKQPKIEVGILAEKKIHFLLHSSFYGKKNQLQSGEYSATILNNQIIIKSKTGNTFANNIFILSPSNSETFFELKNVTIGVDFHWEQKENEQFKGVLKLIPEGQKVRVINVIDLEEYLKSVISSEMSSTATPEFLKAHAVISRSWLMAQIEKSKTLNSKGKIYQTSKENDDEIIRWYDREDHEDFDVCADDHCQRYQGIAKIHSGNALNAAEKTLGEVLSYKNKICDARFSKCCGGITESFENVWEPVHHPYLINVIDNNKNPVNYNMNLDIEQNAEVWIRNNPPAFCNSSDKKVLSQVLPGFDQATSDFYRWKAEYTQNELSELIEKRSGINFGEILNLEPVERGNSGRIIKLKIIGSKRTVSVGKELEIRKWLSKTHLYSSAFVVNHLDIQNGIPQKIILNGAGWGHGVGLCQIGAAVMGEKGYSYIEILNHYFKGAKIKKLY